MGHSKAITSLTKSSDHSRYLRVVTTVTSRPMSRGSRPLACAVVSTVRTVTASGLLTRRPHTCPSGGQRDSTGFMLRLVLSPSADFTENWLNNFFNFGPIFANFTKDSECRNRVTVINLAKLILMLPGTQQPDVELTMFGNLLLEVYIICDAPVLSS